MDGWHAEWKIDSLDETRLRCFCSPKGAESRFSHFGKLFTGQRPSRAYDSFCRSATVGLQTKHDAIPAAVGGTLDAQLPILVFERVSALTLQEWLSMEVAPQPMFRRLEIAAAIVDALQCIHHIGYMHGQISAQHILVMPNDKVQIIGWGACEVVGANLPALPAVLRSVHMAEYNPHIAPERQRPSHASSAEDIFALAFVLGELLGQSFLSSPLARNLLCEDPQDRPTTPELAALLKHFRTAVGNTPDQNSIPLAA